MISTSIIKIIEQNIRQVLVRYLSHYISWVKYIVVISVVYWGLNYGSVYGINMAVLSHNVNIRDITSLSDELSEKTSINELEKREIKSSDFNSFLEEPMVWVEDISLITSSNNRKLKPQVEWWLKRGGFMVIMQNVGHLELSSLFSSIHAKVESVDLNSELMKSYYLLSVLPQCTFTKGEWKTVMFDERIAVVVIPYDYIGTLLSYMKDGNLCTGMSAKNLVRSFINIMLVSLTTDYKNDQTHLPEILKRLR